MKTKIALRLVNPVDLEFNSLSSSAEQGLTLRYGTTQRLSFDHGTLISQEYSHYFVFLQCCQLQIELTLTMKIDVLEDSVFLFMVLEGESFMEAPNGKIISSSKKNSCTLAYLNQAGYKRTFLPGLHQIVLLTFRYEFLEKYVDQPAFDPLIKAYQDGHSQHVLPHCPIALSLFNSLKKMNQSDVSNRMHYDTKLLSFALEALNKYSNYLMEQHYDVPTMHQAKMEEIASYVKENYSNPLIGRIPELTRLFGISRATLFRLSKMRFGMPLGEQIQEYRLQQSIHLLLSSHLSIRQIAHEVGYDDPYYFSRLFKKRFGFSPKHMR